MDNVFLKITQKPKCYALKYFSSREQPMGNDDVIPTMWGRLSIRTDPHIGVIAHAMCGQWQDRNGADVNRWSMCKCRDGPMRCWTTAAAADGCCLEMCRKRTQVWGPKQTLPAYPQYTWKKRQWGWSETASENMTSGEGLVRESLFSWCWRGFVALVES